MSGLEAGRDRAVVGHDVHDRGRQRSAGEQAERPATTDTISASPAISRRTWCGAAPSARSTAISPRRCTIASENVPATTNSASIAADPAHRPEDRHQRDPVGGARIARVGVGRMVAIEHLQPSVTNIKGLSL